MAAHRPVASEQAVSPIVGIVLLAVTTIVLAVSIGAFVTGIGVSQQTGPETSWQTTEATSNGVVQQITFAQTGGDRIDSELLSVVVRNESRTVGDGATVAGGSSIVVSFDNTTSDATARQVKLVFSPGDSEARITLATHNLTALSTGGIETITIEA
jgi:FlaG/FlaF family flagellin (archaellin)